jgi:hypothetical protein
MSIRQKETEGKAMTTPLTQEELQAAEQIYAREYGGFMVKRELCVREIALRLRAEAELAKSRINHIDANTRNMQANERADKFEAELKAAREAGREVLALTADKIELLYDITNLKRDLATHKAALRKQAWRPRGRT